MSIRAFVAIVALLLLGVGIGFLAVPVTVGQYPTVHCGNGFITRPDPGLHPDFAVLMPTETWPQLNEDCRSAVATHRWVGFPAASVGLVVLLGAFWVNNPQPARRRR